MLGREGAQLAKQSVVGRRRVPAARLARRAAPRLVAPSGTPGEAGGWDPAAPDDGLLGELRALTPEHRAVVVLRYLLDWTPGEIAAALDLPRGTINSRLRRALDVLGRRLEESG